MIGKPTPAVTHDASHSYFYDAESRIIQVDGTAGNCATATACYSYDALGRRVERTTGGVKTDYLYDLSGHPVTEFSSSCSMCWTVGYIYLSGGLVAQYSGGTTSFVHGDNLGSSRIVTSLTGSVTDCNAFYPYGEQDATICNSTSSTTHKFEGKERDTETGNDDFGARYYSSSQGRWLSADWSAIPQPVPYANPSNPQTLNLYAMVHDNPETFADLDGHEKCGPSCRGAVFDGGSGGWAGDESTDNYGSFEATISAHGWTPISNALSEQYHLAQSQQQEQSNNRGKVTFSGDPGDVKSLKASWKTLMKRN
ncbi:MAG TPA: RHS repeat-associated core domain-containing protein [Candidatus Acidoferrales bacterium]